ncbi:MAG TPA: glycosyltransferase [Allocoleopsis sp.]
MESLINQTLDEYEIIVIDNASSDGTKEIATSYPQVTYIYEPVIGLSVARNTGTKAASGYFYAHTIGIKYMIN